MKFGYIPLEGFDFYNIYLPIESAKCYGSDFLCKAKVLMSDLSSDCSKKRGGEDCSKK